jgi:kumamolisin
MRDAGSSAGSSGIQEALVLLRPNRNAPPRDAAALGKLPIRARRHADIQALLRETRAARADIQAVHRFASTHGLKVVAVNPGRRTMVLRGSARALSATFKELAGVITSVAGLDHGPAAKRPRWRTFPPKESTVPPPVNPNTRPPKDFRKLYEFPKGATGKGQCIGVLEFGGGFTPTKLRSYLAKLGVSGTRVKVREIPPGGNRPVHQHGTLSPDTEVYMDLEILASVAPDATLVVYFAENTSRGWIEALHSAIFDRKYRPSVLSISWGQAEQYWDAAAIAGIEDALRMAALLGITVCCASGDRGVFEAGKRPYTVPYPGSSPHVLTCGGTQLDVEENTQRETVWNESRKSGVASGGGISRTFGLPEFQAGHRLPARFGGRGKGRGIPDVAANASSATGFLIWADDTAMSLGGTSAATPLWAGLCACLNEALGSRIGYLTPLLYSGGLKDGALRSILKGNNRMVGRQGYMARKGWDACTGLGTPHGVNLLECLKQSPAPRT